MENKKKTRIRKNNSISNPSPRLLQILQNIVDNGAGTVSYIFIEERIIFTNKFPKGKTIRIKSSTSSPINPKSFYKEIKGRRYRKSYAELLEMFEGTSWDMGASYFIIN